MPQGLTYPPDPATVANGKYILDLWAKNPTRLTKIVQQITQDDLLAPYLFGQGDAQGGAVIYDQTMPGDYYANGQALKIPPGGEFPIVDAGDTTPNAALVDKYGGKAKVTYESQRRDLRDQIKRGIIKLTNTMTLKSSRVALAALAGSPTVIPVVAMAKPWTDLTGDPIADIASLKSAIRNRPGHMNYKATDVLTHSSTILDLMKRKDIRDALPKENPSTNPLLSDDMPRLRNLNWIPLDDDIPYGEAWIVQRGIVGSNRVEVPLYTRVVDEPLVETYWLMAGEVYVPVVTDPYAAIHVTGLKAP